MPELIRLTPGPNLEMLLDTGIYKHRGKVRGQGIVYIIGDERAGTVAGPGAVLATGIPLGYRPSGPVTIECMCDHDSTNEAAALLTWPVVVSGDSLILGDRGIAKPSYWGPVNVAVSLGDLEWTVTGEADEPEWEDISEYLSDGYAAAGPVLGQVHDGVAHISAQLSALESPYINVFTLPSATWAPQRFNDKSPELQGERKHMEIYAGASNTRVAFDSNSMELAQWFGPFSAGPPYTGDPLGPYPLWDSSYPVTAFNIGEEALGEVTSDYPPDGEQAFGFQFSIDLAPSFGLLGDVGDIYYWYGFFLRDDGLSHYRITYYIGIAADGLRDGFVVQRLSQDPDDSGVTVLATLDTGTVASRYGDHPDQPRRIVCRGFTYITETSDGSVVNFAVGLMRNRNGSGGLLWNYFEDDPRDREFGPTDKSGVFRAEGALDRPEVTPLFGTIWQVSGFDTAPGILLTPGDPFQLELTWLVSDTGAPEPGVVTPGAALSGVRLLQRRRVGSNAGLVG